MAKILIIPFLLAISYFNHSFIKPPIEISQQNSAVTFNNSIYLLFNLGNRRLFTDVLWVGTLIDSDHDHYKQKNLNSWMYLRFKAIITLDKLFLEAYRFGGMYLSIIKDDMLGAQDIYESGLKHYPDNYALNFNAAFHYYFEMGDTDRAIKLFTRIKDHAKAPAFLPSLIARMEAKVGNLQSSYQLVLIAYKSAPKDSLLKKKLFKSLYAIKAEIDLNCLNSLGPAKCATRDALGQKYVVDLQGEFRAVKEWKIFRPYKNR